MSPVVLSLLTVRHGIAPRTSSVLTNTVRTLLYDWSY